MSLGPSRDEIWCARAIQGLLALSELGFNYQSGSGPFDGTGPGPSGLTSGSDPDDALNDSDDEPLDEPPNNGDDEPLHTSRRGGVRRVSDVEIDKSINSELSPLEIHGNFVIQYHQEVKRRCFFVGFFRRSAPH